jgi:hypothetical protein
MLNDEQRAVANEVKLALEKVEGMQTATMALALMEVALYAAEQLRNSLLREATIEATTQMGFSFGLDPWLAQPNTDVTE